MRWMDSFYINGEVLATFFCPKSQEGEFLATFFCRKSLSWVPKKIINFYVYVIEVVGWDKVQKHWKITFQLIYQKMKGEHP